MVYNDSKNKFRKRKKSSFKFSLGGDLNRIAHLYMRKSFSNIFLTLTDLNDRVIICRTSGSSGI